MLELFQGLNLLFLPLFLVGTILLIIEMFTPGFGVAGVSGIICFIAAVIVGAKNLAQALFLTGIALIITGVIAGIFIWLVSAGKLPSPLVLRNSAKKEEGFISGKDNSSLIGKAGVTVTDLRPAGKVKIEEQIYDVVSNGEFIGAETEIEIISADSNRIAVKRR